mmetsp:Transcript_159541/g.488203  ORF Transcript_159541/g.488203 Transcript_159541/m.488203 type:complete len:144 (+) Transcript_159541:3-434(+)
MGDAAAGKREPSSSGLQDGRLPPGWKRPEAGKPEPPRPALRVPPQVAKVEPPRPYLRVPPQAARPLPPGLVQPREEHPTSLQRKWFYKDSHGNVQGPFTSAMMSDWSRKGFFPETTLVKAEDEEAFTELGNGMRLLTEALGSG